MRRYTIFSSIALMVWIASALPVASATRHVVMLFDERVELPGLAAMEGELVRTLAANSSDHIETYRETMDLSRFSSATHQLLLKDYLRAKYADKKIDVVVAFLEPALEFVLTHGDTMFPGTTIVFAGLDKRAFGNRSLPAHVRGVFLKREFAPTLDLALRLHPQTQRVVVVAGTSEFDTRLLDQARQEFSIYENRLSFTYLTTLPLQKLLGELASLPPQTVVLFTTFFQDGAGLPFVPHDVVSSVSAVASVPTYGFLDQYLGRGIVGGSLYSSNTQGNEAAKLVLQTLATSERSRLPLSEVAGNKLLFDWRQLQRWGISESRLPSGSEIHFREPTIWQQYFWKMVAICAALMAQTWLIISLIWQNRRRRSLEANAQALTGELAHMNRVVTAGQLTASIAHEIRQPLSSIASFGSAGLRWLKHEPPNLDQACSGLENIVKAVHRADDVIKSVTALFKNKPTTRSSVYLNGLIQQVLISTARARNSDGISLETNLVENPPPYVMADPVQLQQVILNLITNAIDAMSASKQEVRILLVETNIDQDFVVITVADSGPGFDSKIAEQLFKPFFTTKSGGMGLGLAICKSIIEAHQGKLTVASRDPHGAVFRIELPRHRQEEN